MLLKSLPYVSLALAAWLTLCPDFRDSLPEIRITSRKKEREKELSTVERMELFAEWSRMQAEYSRGTMVEPRGSAVWRQESDPVGGGHVTAIPKSIMKKPAALFPDPTTHDRLVAAPVEELALVPNNPVRKITPENSRFKPVTTKQYDPPSRPAPPPIQPARGDQLFSSMKQARLTAGAYSSDGALAALSVDADCEEEFIPLSTIARRGRAVPFYAAAPYPELPAKGIYVWGDGEIVRENQKTFDLMHNPYRQTKTVYSLGIKKDWSVDTILGASVDIIDSTVKSRAVGDFRENDLNGFVLNAHYNGTLFGKYPVSLKGFYGRFDNEGTGTLYRNDVADTWREEKHSSELYGGSARIGLPLILDSDIRILPEIGVDYSELHSRAYTYSVRGDSVNVPEMTTKSLAVPLTVTVRKDFLHPWGVFTPHLKGGLVKEFDNSSIGVRTFNSSSIVADYDDAYRQVMDFKTSYDKFYEVGAGFTARTVGGWEVAADYQRRFIRDWHDDRFKFELGRNF